MNTPKTDKTATDARHSSPTPGSEIQLHSTTDATVWTNEWLRIIAENPNIPTDKGTMIGWFANAIMAGYDAGRRAEEKMWIDAGCRIPREACNGES